MTTKYPYVFKTEGKHEDSFYFIPNEQEAIKVFTSLIKERAEMGYYLTPDEVEKWYDGVITSTIEPLEKEACLDLKLEAVPEAFRGPVERARERLGKKRESANRKFRSMMEMAEGVQKVLADEAVSEVAERIIRSRSDMGYQYERIETIRFANHAAFISFAESKAS